MPSKQPRFLFSTTISLIALGGFLALLRIVVKMVLGAGSDDDIAPFIYSIGACGFFGLAGGLALSVNSSRIPRSQWLTEVCVCVTACLGGVGAFLLALR
jgi:hypothetical protein